MAKAQVKDLLEAGVHFGHMTRKWNPNNGSIHFHGEKRYSHYRFA